MRDTRSLVWGMAPVSPPCFPTRLQWLEFLTAAADQSMTRVFVIEAGAPVRLNPRLNFCADCLDQHRREMAAAARCRPAWLVEVLPKETTHAA